MNVINNVQRNIYESLSASYDTCDVPDENAKLPLVRIADMNWEKHTEKVFGIKCYNIRQELHIWSNYDGKKEINEMIEDITEILEGINYGDYNVINNEVISAQTIDLEGYKQAILVLDLKIDN